MSASITVGHPARPLAAGGSKPGHGAFQQDVPFALGERGHHREEELALPDRAVGAGQLPSKDLYLHPTLMQVKSGGSVKIRSICFAQDTAVHKRPG